MLPNELRHEVAQLLAARSLLCSASGKRKELFDGLFFSCGP
jgi:hypothetical protein